jgi:hypothetical protein
MAPAVASRTSLLLLDQQLAGGDHAIPVPDHVPPKAAFATVMTATAVYAFSIATEQFVQAPTRRLL